MAVLTQAPDARLRPSSLRPLTAVELASLRAHFSERHIQLDWLVENHRRRSVLYRTFLKAMLRLINVKAWNWPLIWGAQSIRPTKDQPVSVAQVHRVQHEDL